jgi:hypothetical protein
MGYRFNNAVVPHRPGRVLADTASIIGSSAKYGINLWMTYLAQNPGRLPALPTVFIHSLSTYTAIYDTVVCFFRDVSSVGGLPRDPHLMSFLAGTLDAM